MNKKKIFSLLWLLFFIVGSYAQLKTTQADEQGMEIGKLDSLYAENIKLEKKVYTCTLRAEAHTGNEYMRPISIRLIPIKEI